MKLTGKPKPNIVSEILYQKNKQINIVGQQNLVHNAILLLLPRLQTHNNPTINIKKKAINEKPLPKI